MCHVTIDDPMLSRRHVRIDLRSSRPVIEDLCSRNGTQLNGRPVDDKTVLQDGDRIRIGAQELVFSMPISREKDVRTTSGLTFCIGCALPYPSTSDRCPHCGAVPPELSETSAGREPAPTGWTFHLLSQVVERAIEQGRLADAERMLSKGRAELTAQMDEGFDIEPARVLGIAECAVQLGCSLRSARWLGIAAELYERAGLSPSGDVDALLDDLVSDARLAEAAQALRRLGSGTRRAS